MKEYLIDLIDLKRELVNKQFNEMEIEQIFECIKLQGYNIEGD